MTKQEYKKYINQEIGTGITKIYKILTNNSAKAIYLIRRSQYYYNKGFIKNMLSKLYTYKLVKTYGIFINPNKVIGEGLKLPHPNGIIIGEKVNIGKNCTIYQQVTIGSSHIGDAKKGLQPQIGNNVTLFAGSKIIGNIKVADNTIVGANALLNKSTESNSIYVGIPAKRIESKKKIN